MKTVGKGGLNLWVAEVEDTNDPLKIGRFKVRVIGHHIDNKELLPTAALPWATPLNSPNNPHSVSSPLEGDWVVGFFSDGEASQMPVILGVYNSIPAAIANASTAMANTAIKTDMPPNQTGIRVAGQPTTARLSRGIVANTNIANTNSDLVHACDFKFQLGFDLDLGLGGLVNPVTALQTAIKNGKNNAANIIRAAMTKINEALRAVLKGIILAFSLDASGTFSAQYSFAKNIIRKINYYTKKVAQYVEDAATIYYFVRDLQQLITYLQGLPAKFLAMAQECILSFLSQVKTAAAQIQALPAVALAGVKSQVSGLQTIAEDTVKTVTASASSQNIPSTIITIVNNPTANSANDLMSHFETQANSNTVIAMNASDSFDSANTKSP
jgi:hypothetical protein